MDTSNPRFMPGAIAAGGGVLIAVGSFLPWVTATLPLVGTVSRNGIDGGGDGLISLGIGIAIAIIGLSFMSGNSLTKRPDRLIEIGGLLALVGAALEYSNVSNRISGLPAEAKGLASVGSGIYVIGAGGILAIVGATMIGRIVELMRVPPDPDDDASTPPMPGK